MLAVTATVHCVKISGLVSYDTNLPCFCLVRRSCLVSCVFCFSSQFFAFIDVTLLFVQQQVIHYVKVCSRDLRCIHLDVRYTESCPSYHWS